MITINIGLMESTDKSCYSLSPLNGSRLPTKVQKSFTAAEVLSAEIFKHPNHDSSFALRKIIYCYIQTRKWLPIFQTVKCYLHWRSITKNSQSLILN